MDDHANSPEGNGKSLPVPDRPPGVHRKATAEEKELRVMLAIQLISSGRRDHEIARLFDKEYGLSRRQVQRYIRLARKRTVQHISRDPLDLIAEKHAWYMGVLQDADVSMSDKLTAQRHDTLMLGLEARKRIGVADSLGNDLMTLTVDSMSMEEMKVLDEIGNKQIAVERLVAEERRTREGEERSLNFGAHILDAQSDAFDRENGKGTGTDLMK